MRNRMHRWPGLAAGIAMIAAGMAAPGVSLVNEARAGVDHPAVSPQEPAFTLAATAVIRRSTIYVSTLPKGCVRTKVGNVTLWRCGSTYYQYYKKRYVVVYIN